MSHVRSIQKVFQASFVLGQQRSLLPEIEQSKFISIFQTGLFSGPRHVSLVIMLLGICQL